MPVCILCAAFPAVCSPTIFSVFSATPALCSCPAAPIEIRSFVFCCCTCFCTPSAAAPSLLCCTAASISIFSPAFTIVPVSFCCNPSVVCAGVSPSPFKMSKTFPYNSKDCSSPKSASPKRRPSWFIARSISSTIACWSTI